jgi:hypothetical protein
MGFMDISKAVALPPEPPLRWRPEYINFLRRQYEALDTWASETGAPIASLVRKAVDEALERRGYTSSGQVTVEVVS